MTMFRSKVGVNTATLSGATSLLDNDYAIQRLNPNGTTRTVTVVPQGRGRAFLIQNTGTVAGINLSVVDKDAATVGTIGPGEWAFVVGTGTGLNIIPAGTTAGGSTLDVKGSVRAATVGSNITVAGSAPSTLDGVTLVANDRILVKDQSAGAENGIYYVSTLGSGANGTWTRATDADSSSEVTTGMLVHVSEGTVNADRWYTLTTNDTITLGTTALVFTLLPMLTTTESVTYQVSGSSGSNLTLTLDAVNAGGGEGRTVLAADDQVNIDDGTMNLQFDAGVVTETGMVSLDITPSGAITMKSGTAGIYGDDTGWWDFNGSGAVSETGMTTFSLTPSSTVTITGGGAVLVDTLDVTAGGATAGTASVTIESGARTKNDADAGVPTSGAVVVRSGTTAQTTSAATGGASGNASLGSGDTDVTIAAGTGGASGNVSVRSGNTDISAAVAATGGATGAATFGSGNALSTGAGATSGASGAVILSSGTSADANTGSVTVETGAPAATGTSGNLSMRTGNPSGAGTSGNIDISTGATTGGTRGTVSVTGSTISVTNTTGNLTLDNQATTGATNFDTGTNTSATKVAIRSDAGTEHFAVQGDGGTKFSTATGITAFASGGQASATQLAALFNEITTCATAGDSVKLPAAVAGATVTVKNSGVTAADVFPGSSDSINTLAADAAIRLPSGCTMTFHAVDATVWEVTSRTALDLVSVAAGTSHTGSTDEAVLASRTIQANRLTAGTTCRVAWGARVTADNAGTTLTGRLRLGGTTLTGTELCVTGAVDTSSGHYFSGWFEFVSRATPGAAVAITGIGQTMIGAIGASGAAPVQQALAPTNFATNAALLLEVTADWSAADANAVQVEYFTVSFPNG